MTQTYGRLVVLDELFKAGLEFTLSQNPILPWAARRFDSVEQMVESLRLEAASQDLDVWVYNGPMDAIEIISPIPLLPTGVWILAVSWGKSMSKAQKELFEFMQTPQGAAQFRLPRPLP